jgi:hypothetical protein
MNPIAIIEAVDSTRRVVRGAGPDRPRTRKATDAPGVTPPRRKRTV